MNCQADKLTLYLPLQKYDLYVDVFMELHLGMGVDGNRGEWVLKLNKSLYGIKQANENWFDPLKTGLERRGFNQY